MKINCVAIMVSLFVATFSVASIPKVTVSILPIHGLVEGLMKDVGKPELLLPPRVSPHHFNFKPSQANLIAKADLLIWVGPELETILEKPIENLAKKAVVITLVDLEGLTIYSQEHDHTDPHIWLDPDNAIVIVKAIAQQLIEMDPKHQTSYEKNRDQLLADLNTLKETLTVELKDISDQYFIVYHDAYKYFENAFGLQAAIPMTTHEEGGMQAQQRFKIEKMVKQKGITCVFSEPQQGTRTALALAKQLNLKLGELDPLGNGESADDENSYIVMMNNLSGSLLNCLGKGKQNEKS